MTNIPNPRHAGHPVDGSPLIQVTGRLRCSAGTPVVVTVAVTNQDTTAHAIQVQALGLDPSWLPAPETTATLAPGESATVLLSIAPPVGTVAATYPFVVTAQALTAQGKPASAPTIAEAAMLVNPRAQLRLEMEPKSLPMWRSRRVTVLVHNTGGGTASVRLNPQTSGSIKFKLKSTEVDVPAESTTRVRGRIILEHPRLTGFKMRHIVRVEAVGSESAKYAEAEVVQRPALPASWLKASALIAALALWIAGCIVVLPHLSGLINGGGESLSASGVARPGGSGSSGGGSTVTPGESQPDGDDESPSGVQLNGTISANDPAGTTVSLRRTSLVDEAAIGATPVGFTPASYDTSVGKLMPAALTVARPASEPLTRQVQTRADGVWAFPGVETPGFYLVTFSKPGYAPQSFVIDAAASGADQPLAVDLAPGDGTVSGKVTSGGKAVGAATVTVSDGVSTRTVQTLSKGSTGSYSFKDLATPGSYIVTASKDGLSTESKIVHLGEGGSDTATLALRQGVAMFSGRLTSDGAGIGSATVLVTDSDGRTYTTTSQTDSDGAVSELDGATEGFFHLPGLPAPGSYTVTVRAEGYQTLTASLKIKSGQSSLTRNLALVPATGRIIGQVTDTATPPVGLPDAGLTLTNSRQTYKQTSTTSIGVDGPVPGFVEIAGVAPGTYQLTTELWGYRNSTQTVRVVAGETTRISPALEPRPAAGITATGRITGSVMSTDRTNPLECLDEEPCITATTVEQCPPAQPDCAADGSGEQTYTVTFSPDDRYVLPKEPDGLRPGLHRVTVSADGYESASFRIAVPAEGAATAPTVELVPAPWVQGTVRTRSDVTPSGRACVYLLATDAPAPTTCDLDNQVAPTSPTDPPQCVASPARFGGPGSTPVGNCVVTTAEGAYRIQAPQRGRWVMYVVSSDVNFIPTQALNVDLAPGITHSVSFDLVRYGRVVLTVKRPDTDGTAVAAEDGVEVTFTGPASQPATTQSTLADGTVTFDGLRPGTYVFSAETEAPDSLSGTRSVAVNYDSTSRASVVMTSRLALLRGRVTTQYRTGEEVPVSDAKIAVTGPTGYDDADNVLLRSIDVRSGSGGCFAGRYGSVGTPSQAVAAVGVPSECAPQSSWHEGNLVSIAAMQFVTHTPESVAITAPGFANFRGTRDPWSSTTPNNFSMTALPVSWTGLELSFVGEGLRSSLPNGTVFDVESTDPNSDVPLDEISIVPARRTGFLPAAHRLLWNDALIGGRENQFALGNYTVSVKAPGYSGSEIEVECHVSGCRAIGTLSLTKLGTVTVTVTGESDSGQNALNGATVMVEECTDNTCANPTGVEYTATTDVNGKATLTGTLDQPGLKLDTSYRVTASGPTYGSSAIEIITPDSNTREFALDFALNYKPVKVTVIVKDRYGTLITGATMQAVASTTVRLIEDEPGRYSANLLPGDYAFELESDLFNQRRDTNVAVRPRDSTMEYQMEVARGAGVVRAVVRSAWSQNADQVALQGIPVELRCNPAGAPEPTLCKADGPALGVNGAPLVKATDAQGNVEFDTVPNGTYTVSVDSGERWAAAPTTSVTSNWASPSIPTPTFDLALIKRNVTFTLTSTSPATLGVPLGGFDVELVPTETLYGQESMPRRTDGDGKAFFTNVPNGCFRVNATPPANHYGEVSFDSQSIGDQRLCTDGITVPGVLAGAELTDSVTINYALDAAPLVLTLDLKSDEIWHSAPSSAQVTLSQTGRPDIEFPAPLGSTTRYVPRGQWNISAEAEEPTPGTYPAGSWPVVEENNVTVDRETGGTVQLLLRELRQTVTFDLVGTESAGTLTLSPDSGTSTPPGVVPSGSESMTLPANNTVQLPLGAYTATFTPSSAHVAPAPVEFTVTQSPVTIQIGPLVRSTTSAEVAITSSATSFDASSWRVRFVPGAGVGGAAATYSLSANGTWSGTMPWGCWQVSVVGNTAATDPIVLTTSTGIGCATGEVLLAPNPSGPNLIAFAHEHISEVIGGN